MYFRTFTRARSAILDAAIMIDTSSVAPDQGLKAAVVAMDNSTMFTFGMFSVALFGFAISLLFVELFGYSRDRLIVSLWDKIDKLKDVEPVPPEGRGAAPRP